MKRKFFLALVALFAAYATLFAQDKAKGFSTIYVG